MNEWINDIRIFYMHCSWSIAHFTMQKTMTWFYLELIVLNRTIMSIHDEIVQPLKEQGCRAQLLWAATCSIRFAGARACWGQRSRDRGLSLPITSWRPLKSLFDPVVVFLMVVSVEVKLPHGKLLFTERLHCVG